MVIGNSFYMVDRQNGVIMIIDNIIIQERVIIALSDREICDARMLTPRMLAVIWG